MLRGIFWSLVVMLMGLLWCQASGEGLLLLGAVTFVPIRGFSPEVNRRLSAFFAETAQESGRKVAVFDGDGTVFGQVPHYLADECLYAYAQRHPARRPELIAKMVTQSNVSMDYVQDRVRFLAGLSLDEVRALGDACFWASYPDKVFAPMQALTDQLQAHGFEVWIVTASPEAMYQTFMARAFSIPLTRVLGVKSIIRNGIITDEIIHPVPQDHGKLEAIESFVQARPLLVAGNSRGDKEMIAYSRGLHMIVNPDLHVAEGQAESMADYAARQGWLVVAIDDVPAPGFPAVTERVYGVAPNRTRVAGAV